MKRAVLTLSVAGALLLSAGLLAFGGQGQGPVDDDVRIAGVNLGTYWYGAQINKDDLRGKVVLVEQWGS